MQLLIGKAHADASEAPPTRELPTLAPPGTCSGQGGGKVGGWTLGRGGGGWTDATAGGHGAGSTPQRPRATEGRSEFGVRGWRGRRRRRNGVRAIETRQPPGNPPGGCRLFGNPSLETPCGTVETLRGLANGGGDRIEPGVSQDPLPPPPASRI